MLFLSFQVLNAKKFMYLLWVKEVIIAEQLSTNTRYTY